jgi:hypothetical protein
VAHANWAELAEVRDVRAASSLLDIGAPVDMVTLN